MKKITGIFSGLLLLLFFLCGSASAADAATEPPATVRVGWYEYPGFLMTNKNGYRYGYAYDYLQEIARYGGWNYEYVLGSFGECIDWLQSGQIDLLVAVVPSPERAETMNFSKTNMGMSFSVLLTRSDKADYIFEDYKSFDAIRVGTLYHEVRQKSLAQFAATRGFSYKLHEYSTYEQLESALYRGEVDAILTTNMRAADSREKIIAQFAPTGFYFAASKKNPAMIQAVDAAMEQVAYYRKGFQSELAKKYFSLDISGALSLTEEEREFIRRTPEIQVVLPSPRQPMASLDGEKYHGILVDIMNEIGTRLGVTFRYIESETQSKGVDMVNANQADMIANVYDSYGWAESSNLLLTRPYMTLRYVAVTRQEMSSNAPGIKVAAVKGYYFSKDYIKDKYPTEQITWFDNETDCLEAISNGTCDICFISSYPADMLLSRYRYRNLKALPISYSHGLSIGIARNHKILLSVIDKALASVGSEKIETIIDANIMQRNHTLSFNELLFRYPLQITSFLGLCSLIIIGLIAVLIINRNNRVKNEEIYRAQLIAEHDSLTGLYNRYAFEAAVTQILHINRDTVDGAFVMLDIDDFKQINDQNGHDYGDRILVKLAQQLRELYEPYGALFCRMGGDEFAIFFPRCDSQDALMEILHRGRGCLRHKKTNIPAIPCSMGAAFVSKKLLDFSSLYKAADEALYQAKRTGKNKVCNAPLTDADCSRASFSHNDNKDNTAPPPPFHKQ